MLEIKLPELGENIDAVDVTAVLVAVGDSIQRDQPVVEVETEKASLEVPAESDGKVIELLVAEGDKVSVGQVLLRVEGGNAVASAEPSPPAPEESESEPQQSAAPVESLPQPAATPLPVAAPAPAAVAPVAEVQASRPVATPTAPAAIGAAVPASPSTRRLAREIGVDIREVRGSGPGGRITRDDVKVHAKGIVTGVAHGVGPGAIPAATLPDFTKWGEITTEELTNVRRATAKAMANAWSTVPAVTQFDRADITQLESMRKRFNKRPEAADAKLTMTAIVIKMIGQALKQHPKFNASLDLANDRVIYKQAIHIGCAVDTDRGLLVPVIRDVDKKGLVQVSMDLNDLATRARARKLSIDEMQGATFTVSNLGGLGTTHFSPIVNWPEVAIMGVGRAAVEAVHQEGQFQPRSMMPLSLSYDHRLIDGADAARFLRWVAEALEQPLLLLLDD